MIGFRTVAVAIGLLLLGQLANAQTYDDKCAGCKSQSKGILLSSVCTVAPVTLGGLLTSVGGGVDIGAGEGSLEGIGILVIGTGALLGPGVGHLYAGRTGHFFVGAGIRTLGLAVTGAALASRFNEYATPTVGTYVAAWGGVAIFLGSAVYDIATAGNAVHRRNLKRQPPGVTLNVGQVGGSANYGLKLAIGFQ